MVVLFWQIEKTVWRVTDMPSEQVIPYDGIFSLHQPTIAYLPLIILSKLNVLPIFCRVIWICNQENVCLALTVNVDVEAFGRK